MFTTWIQRLMSRWEMRTKLFNGTLEFLWQEGHTTHATSKRQIRKFLQVPFVHALDFSIPFM